MTDFADPTAYSGGTGYLPIPTFLDWFKVDLPTAEFDRHESLFAQSRRQATRESLDSALLTATRYAAVDTGAIEGLYSVDRGFTRTIATQAAAWEAVIDARGAHVKHAIQDALNAYEYVLDAATRSVQISEVWIRELHSIVCHSQDSYTVYTELGPQERPLPKGEYKSLPNSPSLPDGRTHAYAPVIDTPPEMHRLVAELRSEAFLAAHPILQASYAHYAYVCIHPFADGNGRVARALASVYLYRSPGLPLVVFADQKNEYFDALEAADAGQPSAFIGFIAARVIDAIGIIRTMLRNTSRPAAETLAALDALYAVDSNFAELQAGALRLKALATTEVEKQLRQLTLPPQLAREGSGNQVAAVRAPSHFASIGSEGALYIRIHGDFPAAVNFINPMAAFVRADSDAPSDLILTSGRDDGLEVALREVTPVVTEALKLKMIGWVEGQFEYILADIERQARGARSLLGGPVAVLPARRWLSAP